MISFAGLRVVSWDVDGTLFSWGRVLRPLVRQVVRYSGANGWVTARRHIGEAWRFHRLVERQRRRLRAVVDAGELARYRHGIAWERDILNAALTETRPRERAVALMDRFAAAGIRQVALSDFECAGKVKRLGLERYFAQTYSCETIGFWKPSPIPLAVIQRDFEALPNEHLHIGDRLDTDGEACAANGCAFMPIDRIPRAWNVFNAICAGSALE